MAHTLLIIATLQPPYITPCVRAIETHGRALGLSREQIFDQTSPEQHPAPHFVNDRAKETLVTAILASIPPAIANEAITDQTQLTPFHIYQDIYLNITESSASDRQTLKI